ncbi:MAG: diadenylate cyclase [Candidatus Hadarchaeales archaeon]
MKVPRSLAEAAVLVAANVGAKAVIALTETGENIELLSGINPELKKCGKFGLVVATSDLNGCSFPKGEDGIRVIRIVARPVSKIAQAHHAIARGLQDGVLSPGDRIVCLMGNGKADMPDTLMVMEATPDHLALRTIGNDPVISSAVELSLKLSEGDSGGRPVGTAFIVGNWKEIMRLSHQLMPNPLEGHRIKITDRSQWGFLKKFAIFDGAFVVDSDGTVVAACRYLDAHRKVDVPRGLGTRHLAVASMTAATDTVGVTVSGEDGHVRIFEKGRMVAVLDPKTKLLEYFEAMQG